MQVSRMFHNLLHIINGSKQMDESNPKLPPNRRAQHWVVWTERGVAWAELSSDHAEDVWLLQYPTTDASNKPFA